MDFMKERRNEGTEAFSKQTKEEQVQRMTKTVTIKLSHCCTFFDIGVFYVVLAKTSQEYRDIQEKRFSISHK